MSWSRTNLVCILRLPKSELLSYAQVNQKTAKEAAGRQLEVKSLQAQVKEADLKLMQATKDLAAAAAAAEKQVRSLKSGKDGHAPGVSLDSMKVKVSSRAFF